MSRAYRKHTDKAAKAKVTVIRTQDPNWNYLQVILDVSLAYKERTVVLAKLKEEGERICAQRTQQRTALSSTDPKWDPYNPGTD